MTIHQLSEKCSASPQLEPADIAAIKAEGFTTVVCNRPDGESADQASAETIAAECEANGIAFVHIPIDKSGLNMEMVEAFHNAVTASEGSVLMYCGSGQRSAALWQVSDSP